MLDLLHLPHELLSSGEWKRLHTLPYEDALAVFDIAKRARGQAWAGEYRATLSMLLQVKLCGGPEIWDAVSAGFDLVKNMPPSRSN